MFVLKRIEEDHVEASVISLSHLQDIQLIWQKLTEGQKALFRETCLGHFLNIHPELSFTGNLIHQMLQHEVQTDDVIEDEMWFIVRDRLTRFSSNEFTLITGLKFGALPEIEHISDWLRDTYFGGCQVITLDDIKEVYTALDLSLVNDLDAVKLSLYFLLERTFCGRGPRSRYHTSSSTLRIVDDLEEFNRYPWGSVCWSHTLRSLRNVLTTYITREKKAHTHALAKGRGAQSCAIKYNAEGFPIAYQIWIYEVIAVPGHEFDRKLNDRVPRML